MKITFVKKLEKEDYIFNSAATEVQVENIEEEEWTKLNTIFDHLKEFKTDDDTRKAGYGVLKITKGVAVSFLTDPDKQMPLSVQRALARTKNTVPALPATLLDNAPVIQTLITAAWDTVPLPKKSDCYLTIGLLRYDQNHQGLGPHKDGAQYVTTHLITRDGIEGAESTFYERTSESSIIKAIPMTHRLDSLTFNDRNIFHGVKPITVTGPKSHRDIIVLGFHPAT